MIILFVTKKLYVILERHALDGLYTTETSNSLFVGLRKRTFSIVLNRMDDNCDERNPPKKKIKCDPGGGSSMSNIISLPKVLLLKIFGYLDQRSIRNCAMVCKTLNNVCKDSSLYKCITLKYNMAVDFIGAIVTRASTPRNVFIEYNHRRESGQDEDYTEFDEWVQILFQKCSIHIRSLRIEGCQNDKILLYIADCVYLEKLSLYRCKSSFKTLPLLETLHSITLVSCHFQPKTVSDLIRNNKDLKELALYDNVNVNGSEICEIMSQYNDHVEKIQLSERKRVKSKSLKMLSRLTKLKSLELISGPGFNSDPEDALEKIAAGCRNLEKLVIYGWKEITDDIFIPAMYLCTQLKEIDIRGASITIRSCREAALTLPCLKSLDVFKCKSIKKTQLEKLQRDFPELNVALE